MEPLSDQDLDELLAAWPAPKPPASLERRVLDASGSSLPSPLLKDWLLRGSIQVPVPVAATAMALLMLLFGWALSNPKQVNSRVAPSVGLQPVKRLQVRIIRRDNESPR